MFHSNYWTFMRAWLANPRRVGAVAPSSAELAAQMAAALPIQPDRLTLELGPGTGVVTQGLLDHGFAAESIVALEHSDVFADALEVRFPGLTVLRGDAFDVKNLMASKPEWRIGGAVSSLPLLTMPVARRIQLFEDLFDIMAPGAPLVQFSYRRSPPVPDRGTSFVATLSSRVRRNIPPAWIWRYHRPA